MSLSSPHATRVVLALGSYLAMIGLLGLGLGFIVRSTAGGIASLVGILLVAPGVLAALGTSWAASISHYLPLNAGQAMFNDQPVLGGDLTPGAGTLVMIAWWVGAALVAGVLVRTRDA